MKLLDITPTVSENTAVFPGDQSFSLNTSMSFKKGDHLMLSSMQSTLHIGAHADAPNHYSPEGPSIDQRDLEIYYGPCQVLTVNVEPGELIQPRHLPGQFMATRVLFRTNSFPDSNRWNHDFVAFSAEAIQILADHKVILVGIDTPSIDPANSKTLDSHKTVFENNMAILEGVVLSHVADGVYQLIALPLKLKGADASPVRAVLVQED